MTGANSWIRWTPEEEKRLLNLIAAVKSWTLISGSLKRSMKSVKFHAKTLAQKDRQGVGLRSEEEKRLLNLIAAVKSWTLISGSLKRSMKSVKFHAKTLAQKDRQGLGL